jgi:hypothetical protein
MPNFRKKPVVIEAHQFLGNTASVLEVYRFVNGPDSVVLKSALDHEKFESYAEVLIKTGLDIKTLEGTLKASVGDYIIKGINGEFYPCKPDIFEKTYESVEDATVAQLTEFSVNNRQ